jgi:transposase
LAKQALFTKICNHDNHKITSVCQNVVPELTTQAKQKMARKAIVTEEMLVHARKLVQKAKTARELKAGLSVILPQVCKITCAETAKVLGVGVATIVRMQRGIRDQVTEKTTQKNTWGGRRRQLLSTQEEAAFLAEWRAKAEHGGVLIVPPMHAALEERLSQKIALSTVYRMLARHGRRKVKPDTAHPKKDPEAQEEFKKTPRDTG